MTNVLKRIAFIIFSFVAFVAYAVVGFFKPATLPVIVRAQNITYEETDVMDDLKGATIDGKPFNEADYPQDNRRETQILSFLEYGYSATDETQVKYGLYLYVYNPVRYAYEKTHELNTIQMSTGAYSGTEWRLYTISILDESEDKRFLKCKVNLSEAERQYVLSTLHKERRIYDVSSFELYYSALNNARDNAVGRVFTFTGYTGAEGNPLICTSDMRETLTLDVKHTFFRPDGNNGKNAYTQDSLHSVYFAVPKVVVDTYGAMDELSARWKNAVLAPALVTGNTDAYNEILNCLGTSIPKAEKLDDLDYSYVGAWQYLNLDSSAGHYSGNFGGWTYNGRGTFHSSIEPSGYLETLYMMFYTGDTTNSADSAIIPREEIIAKLRKGGFSSELVNGKYDRAMFSSVDDEYTYITIDSDDTMELDNIVLNQSWWEKVSCKPNNGTVTYAPFEGINAIYHVTADDLSGSPEENSKKLYIAESDYNAFYDFYKANKNDSYVYLLRYQVSDYTAQEATLFKWHGNWIFPGSWEKVDTNAYFFQQTINLDFNIISVKFENDENVETLIPVVSDPVDVVPTPTPPMDTTPDPEPWQPPWWIEEKNKDYTWVIWVVVGVVAVLATIGIVWWIKRKRDEGE